MEIITGSKLNDETEENVQRWLKGNYDAATKAEIRELLINRPEEIIDAFYTTLSFGTGGLRGIMGTGSNRMNIYTVRTATQGLAEYINSQPVVDQGHAVIIGYDSRHHSRTFADEAAKVLAGNGIHVYLLEALRPTPLLSFGCRYKRCTAAIMITASHNPPQYNGYKVYWNDGAQVLSPHDNRITAEIRQAIQLEIIKSVQDLSDPHITLLSEEIDKAYLNAIGTLQNYQSINMCEGHNLKIVYTSLHGTGITLVPSILKDWGFTNLHLVEEQVVPDGNFPTAPSPNPEEKESLKMGIQQMERENADILIVTDPDADRVGVAIQHENKTHILNGNQIAALLLNHLCEALMAKNKMATNGAFIKTIVTTELFQEIANYFQKPCFNVLPGFKYIGEKIRLWEKEASGHQFIFAGEESYGYLYGTQTRDKDAVAAAALICEMALQAKLKNKTLINLLHALYERHGVYDDQQISVKFEESKQGKEKMAKSMQLLRHSPPQTIGGLKVTGLEDFERLIKIDFITQRSEHLAYSQSDLLLFWLEDGSKLIIRPSGTEPKIKIYCSVKEKQNQSIARALETCYQRAQTLLRDMEAQLKADLEVG